MSIKADPALGVPYGNDLQFPGVSGKWYLYVCHDESWYQLKHGLQVWAIKVWFNVSSLSTREGIDGSSNAQEEMVVRQVWKKSEFVTRGPSKLAKQPNNCKHVAHIINFRKNHTTDLAWQHKLNEHSIRQAPALIKTRYALQYNDSHGVRLGATAHTPPDPH